MTSPSCDTVFELEPIQSTVTKSDRANLSMNRPRSFAPAVPYTLAIYDIPHV